MSSAADDGTGDLSSAARPMNMLAAESVLNLALSDPPRWGWTAAGGIADLLPPHEVRLSLVSMYQQYVGQVAKCVCV